MHANSQEVKVAAAGDDATGLADNTRARLFLLTIVKVECVRRSTKPNPISQLKLNEFLNQRRAG